MSLELILVGGASPYIVILAMFQFVRGLTLSLY